MLERLLLRWTDLDWRTLVRRAVLRLVAGQQWQTVEPGSAIVVVITPVLGKPCIVARAPLSLDGFDSLELVMDYAREDYLREEEWAWLE